MTRLHKNLNWLPYAYTNLLLALLAGLLQGIGISLFIPLLDNLIGAENGASQFRRILSLVFDKIGMPSDIITTLVCLSLLIVTSLVITFLQRALLYAYSLPTCIKSLRNELFNSLIEAPWTRSSALASGRSVNLMIQESFRAARSLSHIVTASATGIQVGIFLLISLLISPGLLAFTLPLGLAVYVCLRPLHRRTKFYGNEFSVSSERYGIQIVDYLRNLKLIKATASENQATARVGGFSSQVVDALMKQQLMSAASNFVVQLFPIVVLALIIGLGTTILKTEPSSLLVFLLFLARMAPLMTHVQSEYQNYLMGAPAIRYIEDSINANRASKESNSAGTIAFESLKSALSFADIHYVYPGENQAALKGISLQIPKGQIVGIVGGSGAGKSTIVELICGLRQPTAGQICINETDLRDIRMEDWRQSIGYVSQENLILNDTIRNNVAFARLQVSDDDVRNALRVSHMDAFVDAMPDGLDTFLGDGGVRLSGGQKQRLALARALVGNPPLLLLDEATSALDNETERVVQQAIEDLGRQMTIVVIAHRLTTVRNADIIYVVDKGKVVEEGTFNELARKQGHFFRLLEANGEPST